jgi:hypothetical protein
MARPKPVVLMKSSIDEKFRVEEILQADAIYAVYYDDSPIGLKSYIDLVSADGTPKYKKTSFPSPGHAHALAKRLNKMFNTDKFSVVKMIPESKNVQRKL